MQNVQNITYSSNYLVTYLCHFDKDHKDFHEESLTALQQKATYGKLHGVYKKALNKALQNNLLLQKLLNLLQEFVDKDSSEQSDSAKSSQADDTNNNGNNSIMPQLKNPKKHHGKRRLRDSASTPMQEV
ncbi:6491_t:CDS:2 [Racocetra fulgida]|uniref:6491_t:CDS:1 n=1 Tax=Racocetra fulgida TaxID=60492 RepID=A0A9N9EW88_9GLOM|nr:6491_t:CDS:2 [Racocetra fulgida]